MNITENQKSKRENIFSVGNGQICVYMDGINVHQVFGPTLSAPSYMEAQMQNQPDLDIRTWRESGTGIWRHTLVDAKGHTAGNVCDFAAAAAPCFIRIFELNREIRFRLSCKDGWRLIKNKGRYKNKNISEGFLAYADAGISVYDQAHYPSIQDLAHQFLIAGPARIEADLTLVLEAGKTVWYMVGGSSYPECITNIELILNKNPEDLLEETGRGWKKYLGSGKDFDELLPEHLPGRDKMLSVMDDVSVLIKSQQAAEGAVIAGHNFHMAYVRDQMGVARGLLKMGFLEEARSILTFYMKIFNQYGVIHNAQTIGDSHYFHIHENDNVEITGYLIIQAFDYYEKSGDHELMSLLIPMLEWAWNAQVWQLHENMLPFNGDETYVAGGIMSRYLLEDASAEATLLFLASGERFLPFMAQNGYWTSTQYDRHLAAYTMVQKHYKSKFIINGRLMANRTYREPLVKNRFAKGVCTQCQTYGWIEKNEENQYVCCKCYGNQGIINQPQKRIQEIPSVQMMPLFLGTSLFEAKEMEDMIEDTGNITPPEKVLGYDTGILLINQIMTGSAAAHTTYLQLLNSADKMGGWSEFYMSGNPDGTRYRPWESGINIYALLCYANWKRGV